MAPSHTCVVNQMRQLVYYNLDNNFLKNALFLAERLASIDTRSPGIVPPESAHLLSLCHLRLGDNASAYEYAKLHGSKGSHLGCVYVFAQACLALNRYKDGISALEKSKSLWGFKNDFGKHMPSSRHMLPDAAAAACLLGKLYHGYDDKNKAIRCFEESLKLNPFMWDAFTGLCDMGVHMRVNNIFRMNPDMEAAIKASYPDHTESNSSKDTINIMPDQDRSRPSTRPGSVVNEIPDPFSNATSRSFGGGIFGTLGISQKLNESNPSLTNLPATSGGSFGLDAIETPTGHPMADVPQNPRPNYPSDVPPAPSRKSRTIPGLGMDFSLEAPKIGRNIGTKRSQKASIPIPRAVPYEEHVDESAAAHALRSNGVAHAAGDRKRTVSGQVVPRQTSEDPGAPQRRSMRLFNSIKTSSSVSSVPSAPAPVSRATRELKKTRQPVSKIIRPTSATSTVGRQVSGNRKPVEEPMDLDQKEPVSRPYTGAVISVPPPKQIELDSVKQEVALKFLLELFRVFGSAYNALSRYECVEALHIYSTLPSRHLESPWVMAQMGRAHYEQASYVEAEKYYKKIRQGAPTRFEDMEIYSTILWHLKRETDLAFLAHELIDSSWKSPQAWCALGNSWSLARDHEQALRSFKRATQLDPKFAYAFTLQGHEHVSNEEYDKALTAYRSGMSVDNRHYNALYGVGRVYVKLGNFDKAFIHFERAAHINPTNPVLMRCIGSVLEKQKDPRQALAYFSKATDMAPKDKQSRYMKAHTLMSLGELDLALVELNVLKDIAPDDSRVHYSLGRLYKSVRERGLAVHHFTIALNLDPKASQVIKAAIESIEDDEEDYENSMLS